MKQQCYVKKPPLLCLQLESVTVLVEKNKASKRRRAVEETRLGVA